jgi:hypothetical protein
MRVSFVGKPLYPRCNSSVRPWIGCLVGLTAGLDAVVKRKLQEIRNFTKEECFYLLLIVEVDNW